MSDAERIARAFHDVYERLAPEYGYRTRRASAVPWGEVPEQNRALMIATVTELLEGNLLPDPALTADFAAVVDKWLSYFAPAIPDVERVQARYREARRR